MHLNYLELFGNIPAPIATMLVAMLPIAELRVSIPLAIGGFKMSVSSAYFWSVLGNMIPPVIMVFFLEKISRYLSSRYVFWKNFFKWFFERTRRRAKENVDKYGAWGLFLFVAVPLPVTGAWTGAAAAFIFGIDYRKSIPAILAGVMAAGIIVTLLTVGVKGLVN